MNPLKPLLKTQDVIALWPGEIAPGSAQSPARLTITERSPNPFWPDRILTGITRPNLTAFVPPRPNGAAIIVAPGGAYGRIVLDKEAGELALWLNTLGITAFLLQYRLPGEGHASGPEAPLADAQRAVRLVREHAGAWGLDINRIGFLGGSAGGHLAAMLATLSTRASYAPVDAADSHPARPDAVLLLYPVITMAEPHVHLESRQNLLGTDPTRDGIDQFSLERQVSAATPPCFIVVAEDDSAVPFANSVAFHEALNDAGVDNALHRFLEGGHGFGIRDARHFAVAEWPALAAAWLGKRGFCAGAIANHDGVTV